MPLLLPPGFRVSRGSPGMTGCHECREQVEILFLSSAAKNLTCTAEERCFAEFILSGVEGLNMTGATVIRIGSYAGPLPKLRSSFLRQNQLGKAYFTKLEQKHGKAKALTVLAHKLARAVYSMLMREQAFDLQRFVAASPLRGETEPVA